MKTIEFNLNIDEISLKQANALPASLATEIMYLIKTYMEEAYPDVAFEVLVNDKFDEPIS